MEKRKKFYSAFDENILKQAFIDSFIKMNPKTQINNFVMFVVLIGAVITTIITASNIINHETYGFNLQISIWLWLTLIFANFAEAIAEGKGKAQAESLRKSKKDTIAHLIIGDIHERRQKDVPASELKKGNMVVCEAGDMIPLDGDIIEGIASIDESAITGESAPVIRESGGDRSAVTGGTKVLSDRIVIKITVNQGESFIDKLIQLVEGATRKKTPNEIALSILLFFMTLLFVLAIVTLKGFIIYSEKESGLAPGLSNATIPVLIALIVCLIPTTIGGLLSAIGISGMDRLMSKNVIAMSGKSVEAAGDVDVLLIDKTGTITYGNRQASEFIPNGNIKAAELAKYAQSASLADTTPEGESIMFLAQDKYGLTKITQTPNMTFIPFSAQTAMSGVDIVEDNKTILIRKGSVNAIEQFIIQKGGTFPPKVRLTADAVSKNGATPLVVTKDDQVLGVIVLKDIVKEGINKRFAELRKMGIKTIMITGDNPLTAATIAAEAGVDDYISEAKPEDKLRRIIKEQEQGHLIAMVGDGTNDAPALAQADVAVAMNTGTQAAREAGNMIDLDSSPTKLIEIIEIGKQLLMTRGSLTTFSITNDVSKYFAILPALFIGLYADKSGNSPLSHLDIMHLGSPMSAILSAVIFNAIIIVLLIPLALKGVAYKPIGAKALMVRNMTIYGLGGLIVPFVGIKLIDIFINAIHLV